MLAWRVASFPPKFGSVHGARSAWFSRIRIIRPPLHDIDIILPTLLEMTRVFSATRPVSSSATHEPRDYPDTLASLRGAESHSGNVNQKVEPKPTRLSTPTSPPMASTKCFTIESPSPVPPMSRERPESTR